MKILIAEDEPTSRLLLKRTLEQLGYEVVIAVHGAEAAQILSQPDAPRLVLLDWEMPELDGPTLCRKMRREDDKPYVYLLLLTSRQNSEDVVAGLESGADDYLIKPCAPAELAARLRAGRRVLELEDKLVRAREQMRYRATHDALTGLPNRSAILTFARESLKPSAVRGVNTGLLLCDIDYFKRVNDTYGHPVGDIVLEEVAHRLQTAIRPMDAVGRYGGEEFLVVLKDCEESILERRAEQIRFAVCRSPIEIPDLDLSVTVSIGSVLTHDDVSENDLPALLACADNALYRAKALGRDRVEIAPTFAMA